MSDELADAERYLRDFARDIDPGYVDLSGDIAVLLAEYDRRGSIVEAAVALVAHYEPAKTRDFRDYTGELADLLDVLVAAVEERERP